MMNTLEEALIYATVLYQGKVRKIKPVPYILHPLEVAQILSTMTDDQEIIAAGILHDIVENTDGTLKEIRKRFGDRVAYLVSAESEADYPDEDPAASWKKRKESSLLMLKNSHDTGVQMMWLADKLSNIRSLSGTYSAKGEAMWSELHQSDPAMQCWYYKSVAEAVELTLNRTGAFKEYIKHMNFIWPGSFDTEKARYRKYREVSVDGCKLLGRGAKGDVYRYDDELVIKVYNQNNTYRDVEREIAFSRKAFILGIPTAISFGIVSVGEQYGSMYELVDSETISACITRAPGQVDAYAKIMAELAHTIHGIKVTDEDGFPGIMTKLRERIEGGVMHEDEKLAARCMELTETISSADSLIHGDFHTGNVFIHNGEPLLIDMDRISSGHPIVEISDLYVSYVLLGEDDPSVVENYMGFSYQTAGQFFRNFMKYYLDTEDEARIREVTEKAEVLCYTRLIRKAREKGKLSDTDRSRIDRYLARLSGLVDKLDTLDF